MPESLRLTVLEAVHDQWGHQGVSRTLLLLKSRCFWPRMHYDVKEHVRKCFKCTVAKSPTPKIRSPMMHLLSFKPLELLSINFLKLDKGHKGFEDVLVMTDGFTRISVA